MSALMRQFAGLLFLVGLLMFSPPAEAAGPAPGAGASYPADPASYQDDNVTFIPAKLWGRVEQEPLNLIATVIFALAITHTFLAAQFQKRSRDFERRLLQLEEELAQPGADIPDSETRSSDILGPVLPFYGGDRSRFRHLADPALHRYSSLQRLGHDGRLRGSRQRR